MKKSEIKVKGLINGESICGVLSDLAQSFKEGTVCIENGQEFVTMKPGANIEFEIEASQKKGKEKLTIELTWRQVEEVVEGESGFKISSCEPEITEPSPVEMVEVKEEE